MRSWPALPDVPLRPAGQITAELMTRGITAFRAAGRYLHHLPYSRNSDRSDFRLVLPEGRGTCSTKHALLAELAREQNLPVVLTLGIYEMHERNTPGVGLVLDRYGLPYIPEAHCYLRYAGTRIDVTRSGAEPAEPIDRFLYEEAIVPAQIGDYKLQLHQRFLRSWLANTGGVGGRSFTEAWKIREECIAALAQ
ncbi:MAG TPA: hypothetical protein VKJ47_18520 [Candidatus Binatia bacterium]|nr:hypothetical protein [Candidatus Binatia bacterium]